MGWYLVLSTVASSIIATGVMVFFLYLPLIWNGDYFDVLGALGSAVTKELNGRARFIGAVLYGVGALLFAFLYGWLALSLLNTAAIPELMVLPNLPVDINLFYPLLGLAIGFGHGVVVALLVTIIVIEHHPLERYHNRYILVISQLISHIAFGITVMFFQSQFLQLLLPNA